MPVNYDKTRVTSRTPSRRLASLRALSVDPDSPLASIARRSAQIFRISGLIPLTIQHVRSTVRMF